MTWIDEAERMHQARQKRHSEIDEHATEIYDALWSELKRNVDEARKIERFAGLVTNGQELARVIMIPASEVWFQKSITIALSKEERQITVTGTGTAKITLDIDVCADGFVCIKLNGHKLSFDRAAKVILHPFLFPDTELPSEVPSITVSSQEPLRPPKMFGV